MTRSAWLIYGKDKTRDQEGEEFCAARKAEKELRDAIADITAKLNRSNLLADGGKRYAKLLAKEYKILKDLE